MTDPPALKPVTQFNVASDTFFVADEVSPERDTALSCYIAGPMRGYVDYNYPAFNKAARILRSRGWLVTTPSETDASVGELLNEVESHPTKNPLAAYMPGDLKAVCLVSCVFVLPGWRESTGATLEVTVALTVGTPVFDIETLELITSLQQDAPQSVNDGVTFLPTDSSARKGLPVTSGVLDYFPAAIAAVAAVSKSGNDKHNPGEPLHWSRSKSTDQADCISRHLLERGGIDPDTGLRHSAQLAWRALAMLQIELEEAGEAPLSRGSKE